MGDKQHGHALLTLDAPQQIEDLPLRGHVQRRGRLVRNQQLRRKGQRHGDHHALTLATGQLKRVGMVEPLRVRQADIAEQLDNPSAALGAVFHAMGLQGFVDLSAHTEQRVERAHWLLKHHADVAPAQGAHGRFIQGGKVFAAPAQGAMLDF